MKLNFLDFFILTIIAMKLPGREIYRNLLMVRSKKEMQLNGVSKNMG